MVCSDHSKAAGLAGALGPGFGLGFGGGLPPPLDEGVGLGLGEGGALGPGEGGALGPEPETGPGPTAGCGPVVVLLEVGGATGAAVVGLAGFGMGGPPLFPQRHPAASKSPSVSHEPVSPS